MSEATRKAVVTTAMVQEALNSYAVSVGDITGNKPELEFDKGFRGKGFAVYSGETVVKSFETKEQARDFYLNWTIVAGEVLTLIADRKLAEIQAEKPSETAPKAPRKVAAKKVAGSDEGDSQTA